MQQKIKEGTNNKDLYFRENISWSNNNIQHTNESSQSINQKAREETVVINL